MKSLETRENLNPFTLEELKKQIDIYQPQPGQERGFLKRLLHEKARFKSIFQTERGSYYFVLHTGQSLRIKNSERGLEITRVMNKIFFVDQSQMDKIDQIHAEHGLYALKEKNIIATECATGNFPIEIDDEQHVRDGGRYIKFRESMRHNNLHYGHKIVRIEKN
jgi:hypothetical protein